MRETHLGTRGCSLLRLGSRFGSRRSECWDSKRGGGDRVLQRIEDCLSDSFFAATPEHEKREEDEEAEGASRPQPTEVWGQELVEWSIQIRVHGAFEIAREVLVDEGHRMSTAS